MPGEKNIKKLIRNMSPELNPGEYVFCFAESWANIDPGEMISIFKEKEGFTLVMKKQTADRLRLSYTYVAAWITLKVHSSLEAVGLTAAFSKALAQKDISCNVIAANFHDHIFVDCKDAGRAMDALLALANET